MATNSNDSWVRGSPAVWLDAAYQTLIENGVDSVRIATLSQRLGLSRTSFYWFFEDREALLKAVRERWKEKNTNNLIQRSQAYAQSITEAILNVFDCWLDSQLFDSRFEFAMRNWAQQASDVADEIAAADAARIDALKAMFIRFEYEPLAADVRARTIYLTQIGYISMRTVDSLATRMARIPDYVEIFTAVRPTQQELERFFARHEYAPATSRTSRRSKRTR